MVIPKELLDEIVEHARAESPNECCGVLGTLDGRATRAFAATNKFASPLRFEIDEQDLIAIYSQIDEAGWELGAIYHSHTRSAPYPSQTDINFAKWWPGSIWVIVGLAQSEPEVRAFTIADQKVSEVELQIV